jgi:hypothetical protein
MTEDIRKEIDLLHDEWFPRDEFEFWTCVEKVLTHIFGLDQEKASDIYFVLWDHLRTTPHWAGKYDVFYRNDPVDVARDLVTKQTQTVQNDFDTGTWLKYFDILKSRAN